MKTAERQYLDAFEDELKSFIERVRTRAKARIEEATRLAEEVGKSLAGPTTCHTCTCLTTRNMKWYRVHNAANSISVLVRRWNWLLYVRAGTEIGLVAEMELVALCTY